MKYEQLTKSVDHSKLEMECEQLKRLIDSSKLEKISNIESIGEYYLTFPLTKKNGKKRWIDAPILELKLVQNQILDNILIHLEPHNDAVGFKPGSNMIEGAKKHLGHKAILNIDLKNFFHSVKFHQVVKIMAEIGTKITNQGITDRWYRDEIITLTRLCCYKNRLPQGAPTSPYLSNLAARQLDTNLKSFSLKHNLTYSRYADDMSFSHPDGDIDLMEMYHKIIKIVDKTGFKINYKKTRIQRSHQRMSVTGINVNKKLGVPKWKWRNFRAKLHNLEKSGKPISYKELEKLKGYAEWIRTLNRQRGEKFLKKIGQLTCKPS